MANQLNIGGTLVTAKELTTLTKLDLAPINPINGDMYFDTVNNTPKMFVNGVWEDIITDFNDGSIKIQKKLPDGTFSSISIVLNNDSIVSTSDIILTPACKGKIIANGELVVKEKVSLHVKAISANIPAATSKWTTIKTLPEISLLAQTLTMEYTLKDEINNTTQRCTLYAECDGSGWSSTAVVKFIPAYGKLPCDQKGTGLLRIVKGAKVLELQAYATSPNPQITVIAKLEWIE